MQMVLANVPDLATGPTIAITRSVGEIVAILEMMP